MQEAMTMLFRSLFIYLFVLLIMRLMGKREIGKLSVFDLVVSIMIADFAVISIENTKMPFLNGLLPIVVMMAAQILFSWLSLKSSTVRNVIDGRPTFIIKNGKINEDEMKKHRYNMDDLLLQLREHKIANVDDVEFAILETTGKLSIFPKEEKAPVLKGDLGDLMSTRRIPRLPVSLVIDSQIQQDSLKQLGLDEAWLRDQLQRYGHKDLNKVFFVSIDHKGKLYVDSREDG
ncbi:DUF421 domain-containing protein [Kroppenstedtia eburnea]